MASKSISARDQRIATATSLASSSGLSREQTISVTDLISEGEIEGLVNNEASIYLNNERVKEVIESSIVNSSDTLGGSQASIVNGSATFTVNKVLPSDTLIYGVSRWVILKEVYNSVVTIGSLTASDYEVQVPALTLSTGTAFFDSAMNTWEPDRARLIISDTQEYISGTVTTTTSTSAKFNPDLVSGIVLRRFTEAASGKSVSLSVDVSVLATSITIGASSSTITTPGQIPYPTGTYDFDLGSTLFVNQNPSSQAGNKFQGLSTQFRTGTADQLPMTSFGGVSATVLSNPVNFDLTFSDSLSENPSGTPSQPVTLTSTDSFNLSPAKAKEVDEVRVLFSYGSLFGVSERDGKKFSVAAEYKIEAKIYRTASEYNTVVLAPRRRHTANSNTAVTFEEKINLEPFQPFFKFDIIVTRLTRQDGRAVLSTGESSSSSSSKINATAKLTLATAIIKENLNYPFSAYANVTFSSKDFTSTPKRTYHARGIKVKVPSNYITREQNGTNLAEYDGLWDGSFYDYNVYTNNPAWVFYDILTNNRYGLGDWISSYDIDKFALYRIAKYCDELVPDGKGGQEPRFTSNIYLTKAADAYKVLKDITSSFLTMLYWLDGQMLSVMDLPKEAIYTFSGGNVKDGVFTYESTGTKTRANQVIVSWNNPDNDYKLEPLIVEDRQNIVDTGRIIEESAVAFGCTSEGQALRYGRWKLWTAINQTKVVSFSTSINAAFLTPGDIIKIQDQDQSGLAYSGRVSSTGTLDTNTIPLDREVILNAGSTYHLSVLIDAPAVSNEGEEEEHETLVETKLVTSTGTVTSLELSTPFTEVPGRSTIWALKETTAVGVSPASAKDYKILAISEESVSEYGIIAVEHYNEKFTDVDGDFTLIAPDTAFAQVKTNDFVPKPRNVYIESAPDYNRAGDEFRASWDLPQNLDGSFYDQCSGFEILHNIPGYDELLAVPSTTNSFVFNSVPNGSYFVAVRTVNSINNRSAYSTVDFDTINYFDLKVPRLSEGLGVGGTANSGLRLSDTYVLNFEDTPVSLFPSVNPFETFSGSITGVNTISGNLADDTYQVLFDSSAATLKIVKYHVTAEHKVNYWYDAIAANGTPENTFSSNTGTVTINAGSAIATGTGTSFTTEYAIGSIIRFSATQAAKVSSVTSDTEIVLDRSFTAAITASGHKSAGLNIDLLSDVVVAEITKSGNTSTLKSFTAVDTTLTGPAGAGVVPIYASDAAGNDQSYAQGSLEYVTYYEYVETKPTLPVTGETFIKFVGTDGTSEGVKPIFADDAAGTNATFTYSNQEFINFYEWTDSAPSTVPAGLTYVKYVGTDADALVIDSVDTSVAGQTTLSFSDGTSFTVDDGTDGDPGDTIGVAAIFASDAAGNGQSYTQGTLAYVNYYEYTNTKPTLPVTGQTFVKYIGTDGDSEGVIPIYATSAAGANATFTYSSQEFVNFYEWTGSSPTTVPTGLTYVKFVGDDGQDADALVIDSVDTSVAGQTTLSFSDGTSFTVDDGTDGDPGDTIGVAAIFASDAAGNGQSYTQGTLAYVNYYEYTNTKPTLPVTGQTFVKYIGTDGDSEGVIPIYATSAAGANATFTYSSQEFVNFYEWTGSSPTTVPTGLTYVKFVGTDGTPGDPGDAGLRTAHGYLYYEKTTAGAPSAPVGNTYTWSAGVVTGAGITHPASATNTWTNSAREQDATSTNTYYAVPYLVNETSAGSIVSVATYGTVIIHTNFTGVVTFDGTNLVDGTSTYNPASVINSNVTTIDGGKITTDSIDANKLSVGELSAITADLGSITAGTMKNSGANSIPDANSAPSGSEKGAHIDLDNGRFVFGDADQHILYDGTNLTIKGTLNADNIVGDVVDIIPFEAPQASATGTTAQQDAFAIVLDAASHAGGHIPTAIVSGYVKSGVDEKTYLRMFFKTDTAQSVSIGNVASVFVDAFKGTTDLTFNGDVSAAVGFGDFVTQGTVSGQVQSAFYDGTGITYVTIGSIPAPNYTVGPEAFAGLPANTYVQAAVTVCGRTGSSNQEKPFALTGSLGSHVTGIVTMKITLAKETTSNTVYMFNTTGIIMGVR